MNVLSYDVLLTIYNNLHCSQRKIASLTGCSVGTVNNSLQELKEIGYLTNDWKISDLAINEIKNKSPRQAVILAAGEGIRMYPIQTNIPKAFLKVHGEYLIERIIRQLHEIGVFKIYIVVGFMKESFEYLIDEYGVELIVNSEYNQSGNIYSLFLASKYLMNTYIIPSDVWCRENPFRKCELYSWYMVSTNEDLKSDIRVNRKNELVRIRADEKGQQMIGISYITEDVYDRLHNKLIHFDELGLKKDFWEEALYEKDRMIVKARSFLKENVSEINTYVQLCNVDKNSPSLLTNTVTKLLKAIDIRPYDVSDITYIKEGITNTSFAIKARGKKYFITIPKENAAISINYQEEWEVYQSIKRQGFCEDPVYVDSESGIRIFYYIDNIRHCDPRKQQDVERCMRLLKKIHTKNLKVRHTFDLFQKIQEYENQWGEHSSAYRDYKIVKERVFRLKTYIEKNVESMVLTHNDPVADNFIFQKGDDGEEILQLIDWEFAAMQDPHIDIAMFAVFAMYDRNQIEKLIDIYFEGECTKKTRNKIYCYISACGLLWSNWCENLRIKGEYIGEYSLKQYRYAKIYSVIANEEIMKEEKE